MAGCGKFFYLSNVAANCRNFLSVRNGSSSYQYCALGKFSSVAEKQGNQEKLDLPQKPKQPLIPYFRFLCQMRPKMIKENPGLKMSEITKLIAKDWAQFDPAKKESMQEEYKQERQLYMEKKMKYDENITPEQKESIKFERRQKMLANKKKQLQRRSHELGKPKKPNSAYIEFMKQAFLDRDKGVKSTEFMRTAAKTWNSLSEDEKQKYTTRANAALVQYKKEIKEWEEKMIRLGHIDLLRADNAIDFTSKEEEFQK